LVMALHTIMKVGLKLSRNGLCKVQYRRHLVMKGQFGL
jgi:hypothetical protein